MGELLHELDASSDPGTLYNMARASQPALLCRVCWPNIHRSKWIIYLLHSFPLPLLVVIIHGFEWEYDQLRTWFPFFATDVQNFSRAPIQNDIIHNIPTRYTVPERIQDNLVPTICNRAWLHYLQLLSNTVMN